VSLADRDAGRDLSALLRAEGLAASPWSNGPGDRYAAHDHGYDKVIVVEAGSIEFGLPDRGESVALVAGDRLELPAGTTHDALVGPAGVICLEAHAPTGSLAGLARRPAGTWPAAETKRAAGA
jgi:quercetin dioxygenase-like cupin family protein